VVNFSRILEKGGIFIVGKISQKAFAYITHQKRLLVFRHADAPEAGVQVPAGTIKALERPEQAVLREAVEETGLTDLTVGRFLQRSAERLSDSYDLLIRREIATVSKPPQRILRSDPF
jgi:8-oxo-dGTP pyrophosphatase MutT (NUDIX family)